MLNKRKFIKKKRKKKKRKHTIKSNQYNAQVWSGYLHLAYCLSKIIFKKKKMLLFQK